MRRFYVHLLLSLMACQTSVDALLPISPDQGTFSPDFGLGLDAGTNDTGADVDPPSENCEQLADLTGLRTAGGRLDVVQLGEPDEPTMMSAGQLEVGILEDGPPPLIIDPSVVEVPRVRSLSLEPIGATTFSQSVLAEPTPFAIQALERGCNFVLFRHERAQNTLEVELVGDFCGAIAPAAIPANRRPISPIVDEDQLFYGAVDEDAGVFSVHRRSPDSAAQREVANEPFDHPKLIILRAPVLGGIPSVPLPVALYRPRSQPGTLRLATNAGSSIDEFDHAVCGGVFDVDVKLSQVFVTSRCGDEVKLFTFSVDSFTAPCTDCPVNETLVGRSPSNLPPPQVVHDGQGTVAVAFWEEGATTPSLRFFSSSGMAYAEGTLRLADRFEDQPEATMTPTVLDIVGSKRKLAVLFDYEGDAPQERGTLARLKLCPLE